MHADASLTRHILPDEDATRSLGASLAAQVAPGSLVFLEGDLGAGKTTFAQGFLRARGWTGTVRSPTYPIVRTYPLEPPVHHLDLYRLGSLEEVLGLDVEPLLAGTDILLVEWPDRMEGQFPPDWTVELSIEGSGRVATLARHPRTPLTILEH